MKNNQKFVICAIRYRSGGSLVLHHLCRELRERGYDARVFYLPRGYYIPEQSLKFWLRWIKDTVKLRIQECKGQVHNILLKTDFNGCKRQWLPFVKRDTIVVYNENVYGNPLRADHCVRWMLSYYPFADDLNAYGSDDLVLSYRDIFNDERVNPQHRIMTLSSFDFNLYKQTNYGHREGICYVIRKGKSRNDLPTRFDGIIIDDLPETEKVRVLNQCEFCYLYDTQTAYAGLAALCGCLPVVFPEEGKGRKDYLKQNEFGYGVAYGLNEEEIKWAKETRLQRLRQYEESAKKNNENIEYFIRCCNEKFMMN